MSNALHTILSIHSSSVARVPRGFRQQNAAFLKANVYVEVKAEDNAHKLGTQRRKKGRKEITKKEEILCDFEPNWSVGDYTCYCKQQRRKGGRGLSVWQ